MNDPLSAVFYALADPSRRAILARLSDDDATFGDLARTLPIDLRLLKEHLEILERAGLVFQLSSARWARCRFDPHKLKGVSDWIDRYKRFWTGSLDNLENYLRTNQE